jgi:putative heme iron utilization protein
MSKLLPEEHALKLIASRKTLNLATSNEKGEVWASYAPFVFYAGSFYLSIAYISRRTRDILATKKACVHIQANEDRSVNMFALERFEVFCDAVVIEKDSHEYGVVEKLFLQKFNPKHYNLAKFPDTYMVRLDPRDAGRYVKGFAQAFDVAPNFTSSEHVQGGHTEREGDPSVTRKKGEELE